MPKLFWNRNHRAPPTPDARTHTGEAERPRAALLERDAPQDVRAATQAQTAAAAPPPPAIEPSRLDEPVPSQPEADRQEMPPAEALERRDEPAPSRASGTALVPPPRVSEHALQTYAARAEREAGTATPEPGERVRRAIPHAPDAAQITLGRAANNDLVLGSPQVGLRHAVIERSAADRPWELRQLGSTVLRTFVNGRPVTRLTLAEGDAIRIGPYQLEVKGGEITYFDEAAGLVLQAIELHQEVGRGKTILHNVSLLVEPHEFVAIVGASGSGKTTLLRALNGADPARGGDVLLNGYPLYQNFETFRSQIGSVPQEDIVHTSLTVEQALRFAARLRLPLDTSKAEREARVDEVIEELGLTAQRTQVIAHLSGGQRKRVSIGVELLTKPALFFLDEPTSGLDPATGRHTLALLRQLAHQGRTIVVTTHLTRDISLCDKVLFLARGGRLAFFGTPAEALHYFGVQEIEEVYDLLEERDTPEAWEARFRESDIYRRRITTPLVQQQAATLPRPAGRRLGGGRTGVAASLAESRHQFWVLSARYAITTLRDRKHLAVLLLQAPIIALLLWALFQPDVFTPPSGITVFSWHSGQLTVVPRDPRTGLLQGNPGTNVVAVSGPDCAALASGRPSGQASNCNIAAGNGNNQALKAAQLAFLLAATAVWLGTLAAIREIAKEHAIYERERLVNLRVLPYIGSKFAVLVVLVVIQTVALLGVTAAYIHFPGNVIAGAWLSLLLGGVASVAVALAVSAAVTNPERAIVFAPLIMVPQILLAGGLSPVNQLGVAKPLSTIVATRWTYEAVARTFHVLREAAIPAQFPYADAVQGPVIGHWLILVGFVVGFGLLAAVLQRLKDPR